MKLTIRTLWIMFKYNMRKRNHNTKAYTRAVSLDEGYTCLWLLDKQNESK